MLNFPQKHTERARAKARRVVGHGIPPYHSLSLSCWLYLILLCAEVAPLAGSATPLTPPRGRAFYRPVSHPLGHPPLWRSKLAHTSAICTCCLSALPLLTLCVPRAARSSKKKKKCFFIYYYLYISPPPPRRSYSVRETLLHFEFLCV